MGPEEAKNFQPPNLPSTEESWTPEGASLPGQSVSMTVPGADTSQCPTPPGVRAQRMRGWPVGGGGDSIAAERDRSRWKWIPEALVQEEYQTRYCWCTHGDLV
jgi:hypothetical protein